MKEKPALSYVFNVEQFQKLCAVALAASDDKSRSVIEAVLLEATPKEMRAWATDSFQLVTRRFRELTGGEVGKSLTDLITVGVSSSALRDVWKEFKKSKAKLVTIEVVQETHLRVILADRNVELRHVEGKYPDYRRLIKDNLDKPVKKDQRLVFSPWVLEKTALGMGMERTGQSFFPRGGLEMVPLGDELSPNLVGMTHDHDTFGLFMPIRVDEPKYVVTAGSLPGNSPKVSVKDAA